MEKTGTPSSRRHRAWVSFCDPAGSHWQAKGQPPYGRFASQKVDTLRQEGHLFAWQKVDTLRQEGHLFAWQKVDTLRHEGPSVCMAIDAPTPRPSTPSMLIHSTHTPLTIPRCSEEAYVYNGSIDHDDVT